jgi:hypothetical protein
MYVSFLIKIVVLDVYWIVEEPPVRLEIRPPVVLPVGNQGARCGPYRATQNEKHPFRRENKYLAFMQFRYGQIFQNYHVWAENY